MEGHFHLDRAMRRGRPGAYQLQAAIAALHDQAPSPDATDWRQIATLYETLWEMTGSPIVALNRAAALGMAEGPDEGLRRLREIEASGALSDYHLLFAAKADFLRRSGRHREALVEYERALALVRNDRERSYLLRRKLEASRNFDSETPRG